MGWREILPATNSLFSSAISGVSWAIMLKAVKNGHEGGVQDKAAHGATIYETLSILMGRRARPATGRGSRRREQFKEGPPS